ncbi:unnamed protein product [Ilex paraguariensis]|uniref:RIN4 pathogenic type III effector avirulence factor Avr cleavage site domain-containing protein n=1 Tax=Ilex paraguariensis TaxID=185542 RepID=A0ABC8ULD1_9AQUA
MAQRSHVPKFGNWDGDNVPYTAYFENARKDKAGGVKMNPNDPEENPEAFNFGRVGDGSDSVFHAVQSPAHVNPDKSAEKYLREGHKQKYGHQRNTSDHQMSVTQKSMTSESASDKSNSDYSLLQANHRHARADRKKSMTEDNSRFCLPSPGPNRPRGQSNPYDDISCRSASVPKFGAWDEQDPQSAEGFTVIFNKVKEEKHIAAAKLPIPPQPSNYSNNEKKQTGSKV